MLLFFSIFSWYIFLVSPVTARRNENAQFERDNLQTQLRETRHQMDQQQEQIRTLQARYCTAQSQIAAVQVHADSLSNQLAKVWFGLV